MSEPSAVDWKQAGLVGGIAVASLVLLGMIAHTLGFVVFENPFSSNEAPVDFADASPSELIKTPGGVETPSASHDGEESDEAGETGNWIAVYDDITIYIDGLLGGTDACRLVLFDLDDIDTTGLVHSEVALSDTAAERIDLIWDPCTGHDRDENYLYSNATVHGSHWVKDTMLDASGCYRDTKQYALDLSFTIDPRDPGKTWFDEGKVLCVVTSEEHVVLAELISVEANAYENGGMQALFTMSLWVRT